MTQPFDPVLFVCIVIITCSRHSEGWNNSIMKYGKLHDTSIVHLADSGRYGRNVPDTDASGGVTKKPQRNSGRSSRIHDETLSEEPRVTLNITDPAIELEEGKSLSVECKSNVPLVFWRIGRDNIRSKDDTLHTYNRVYAIRGNYSSILVLDKVVKNSEGRYGCFANAFSSHNFANDMFDLKVTEVRPIAYLSVADGVVTKYPTQHYNVTCTGSSNNITWTDPSNMTVEKIYRDGQPYVNHSEFKSHLIFRNIEEQMSGIYLCTVDLHGRRASVNFTLDVPEDSPTLKFSTQSDAAEIEARTNYSVICEGKNFSSLIWEDSRRKQISFSNNRRLYQEYAPDGTKLVISNSVIGHTGNYTCVGIFDEIRLERTFSLNVIRNRFLSNPIFEPPVDTEIWLEIHQSLNITCKGDTENIQWLGSPKRWIITDNIDENIHATKVKKSYDDDDSYVNTLVMNNLTVSDAGEYVCNVSDHVRGQSRIKLFKLNVIEPLHFVRNSSDYHYQIEENKNIALDCAIEGEPKPILMWYFNKEPINDTIQHANIVGGKLLIKAAKYNYTGDYICEAHQYKRNEKIYEARRDMSLQVRHKPIFPRGSDVLWYNYRNRSMDIACDDVSYPKALHHWYRNGIQIGFDKTDNFITITFERDVDFDSYLCMAYNEYGSATQNITVLETEEPDIPSIAEKQTCGTSIRLGLSSKKKSVTGFVVEYKTDDQESFDSTKFSLGSDYVLRSLQKNSTYTLRAASLNPIGRGDYSENLTLTTTNGGAISRYEIPMSAKVIVLSIAWLLLLFRIIA